MNRRAFLIGLTATSAIAACPAAIEAVLAQAPETEWKACFEQWIKDTTDVFVKVWEDQIIYGVGAYEYTDTYPYIERLDPRTLPPPIERKGLFT
jgi:hypothetical protein